MYITILVKTYGKISTERRWGRPVERNRTAGPASFRYIGGVELFFPKTVENTSDLLIITKHHNKLKGMQNKSASQVFRKTCNFEQHTPKHSHAPQPHPNRLLTHPTPHPHAQKIANSIKQMQSKIEGVENMMKKKFGTLSTSLRFTCEDSNISKAGTCQDLESENVKKMEKGQELKNKILKGASEAIKRSHEIKSLHRSQRLPEPNKYNQDSPLKHPPTSHHHLHQSAFLPTTSSSVISSTSAASSPESSRQTGQPSNQKTAIDLNASCLNQDSFTIKSNTSFLKMLNDVTSEEVNQTSFMQISPCKNQAASIIDQLKINKSITMLKLKTVLTDSKEITPDTTPAPKRSKVIQGFEFGKILGKGKFGEVYLARHVETGFVVAIKKLKKSKLKEFKMIEQLIKQITLHSSLDHPKIVKFYGFFEEKEDIYLVLEYINGGTLFEYQNKVGTLSVREAVDFLRDVIEALMYLHERSIAHRDIKPENIVISTSGLAKVCDFGWSALVESARTTFCGTLDYASPEIIERKQYDWSVDVWCIGVLTYELFVGRAPFEGGDRNQVMQSIVNVDKRGIPYLQRIPDQAREFIAALLQKDPSERPKINELLHYPLFLNHLTRRKAR